MKSVDEMIAEARQTITEHTPAEALRRQLEGDAVIVDIRDVRELQREGAIPGAIHAPRGMLEFWVDPQSPYHKPIFAEDREFILHCASGWRSALSAKTLDDMGMPKVSHMVGGFSAWRDDDLAVATHDEWKAASSS